MVNYILALVETPIEIPVPDSWHMSEQAGDLVTFNLNLNRGTCSYQTHIVKTKQNDPATTTWILLVSLNKKSSL